MPRPSALLDSIAENLLQLYPEGATSLGIDIGRTRRAPLAAERSFGRRSAAGCGDARSRSRARRSVDESRLSFPVRTSVEVVRSAYRTALEGFAFPYGDVAVGGWRNTPYVVIQNVGAYIDTRSFLDTDHPIENRADAEAYLAGSRNSRGSSTASSSGCAPAARKGVVPPNFLLDKAIAQLAIAAKDAQRGRQPRRLARPPDQAKGIAGDWDARARRSSPSEVAPALERQIAELQAERAVADGRRRHVVAPARRRILPLGAEGATRPRPDARRGPPDGPRPARRAARPDGPDPQERSATRRARSATA